MSLIDDMSKTMTTQQVYNKLKGNREELVNELTKCSVGNRLAIYDLMQQAYRVEPKFLEREEFEDKDILEELRGNN